MTEEKTKIYVTENVSRTMPTDGANYFIGKNTIVEEGVVHFTTEDNRYITIPLHNIVCMQIIK